MTRSAPFRNLTRQQWRNLALAAFAAFYLIQFAMDIYWQNTCGHLAIDYCTFWSAGQIANHHGYARVYDLSLMSSIQKAIFPRAGDLSKFAVVPTPYLPVFILPFQILALLSPIVGFWIWTAANLIAGLVYLRFFALNMTKAPLRGQLLALLALSLPVFLNFLYGQVNVWLMICTGEFLRASISGRPFRAGVWLGGLLIKPQSLILLVPALLIQRAHKCLAGLAASSAVVLGTSLALMGIDGYRSLAQLWFGYASGLPAAIGAQVMMNWRMLAMNLSSIIPAWTAWAIAVIGLAATVLATLALWMRRIDPADHQFVVATLGTLAATGLAAWHSHVSTSIILIPPLICLSLPTNRLPRQALAVWAFVPTSMYVALVAIDLAIQVGILPPSLNSLLNFLAGGGAFGMNVLFVVWAFERMRGGPHEIGAIEP